MKNAPIDPVAEMVAPLESFYAQQLPEDGIDFKGPGLTSASSNKVEENPCALLEATVRARLHKDAFQRNLAFEKWLPLPQPAHPGMSKSTCPATLQPANIQNSFPVLPSEQQSPTPETFRLLLTGLRKRGIDTTAFRRSTPLQPLLHRYAVELTEEVTLINPYALPPFVHKENVWSRIGLNLVIVSLLATMGLGIAHSALAFATAGGVLLGCALVLSGETRPPRPVALKGLHTLGDLVERMESMPGT